MALPQGHVVVGVLADLDIDAAAAIEQIEGQVVAEGPDFDFGQVRALDG